MTCRSSIVGRNAELDALRVLANNGKVRVYTGGQPATPETAASGTLLVEWTLPAAAFGAAAAGAITANAITSVNATGTGTAGWFRVLQSDGTTPLWDGLVGAEMTIDNASIATGQLCAVTSLTYTLPM